MNHNRQISILGGHVKHLGLQYKQEPSRQDTLDPVETYNWTLSTLENILIKKDFGTKGHSERLVELAAMLGEKIGLGKQDLFWLQLFARFHDLGKVFVPDFILFKKEPLNGAEWEVMRMHSEIGAGIAERFDALAPIADYIRHHHERWDGHGYPSRLRGLEIPLFCRILSLIDSWDAMINKRFYRNAMSRAAVEKEITKNAGLQFDPTLVEIWRSL